MEKGREPEYRTVSELARGGTPGVIKAVVEEDKTVILTKQGKPQAVIISFDKYNALKYDKGMDI